MTLLVSSPEICTLADLLDRLGGVPPERVRFYPLPGTATEEDVVAIDAHEDRLCELVDGVLDLLAQFAELASSALVRPLVQPFQTKILEMLHEAGW